MPILTFSGLHCEACAKLITKKLNKLEGVTRITPLDSLGVFEVESTKQLSSDQISAVIEDTDYQLESIG